MNLTTREKYIAIIAAAVIALLAFFQLLVSPSINRTKTLERVIAEKNQTLADITTKSHEHKTLNAEVNQLRQKLTSNANNENMLSTVEKIQLKCGLKQNIVSMKPSASNIKDIYNESSVEISMQKITLDKLVMFLTRLESASPVISVRSLEIKHTPQNSALLNITIKLTKISI